MSKSYDRAPTEVAERAYKLIGKYHPDVNEADLTIDFIFVRNPDGAAVTHGGYRALALCKVISLKDRAMDRGDVEIQIDAEVYEKMSSAEKDALLDHELYHIEVQREDPEGDGDQGDARGSIKTDDLDRPKVRLKKHDYQFGWFTAIAERHGPASPEVVQAKILWDEAGQAFFPMLVDSSTGKKLKAPKAEKEAA